MLLRSGDGRNQGMTIGYQRYVAVCDSGAYGYSTVLSIYFPLILR